MRSLDSCPPLLWAASGLLSIDLNGHSKGGETGEEGTANEIPTVREGKTRGYFPSCVCIGLSAGLALQPRSFILQCIFC